MTLLVFGINHKTAPLAIREKAAINKEQLADFLRELLSHSDICEAIVLSTCNRTEIYCDSNAAATILQILASYTGLNAPELNQYCYQYHGKQAIIHIMRVACGLDSMIMGEPQIFGQLKTAVALAENYETIGPQFKRLFQQVFSTAKQVRTHTEIGACPISIAANAIKLAKQVLGDLSDTTALLIGAGEITALAAKYLVTQPVKKILIASRHLDKAQEIAIQCQGTAILLEDLHNYVAQADLIFSATASKVPILGKGAIEHALKVRQNRAMCLLDMAVPRDIEAEVAELPVHLFTIDDLKKVIDIHHQSRLHAAEKAKIMIEEQAEHFMRWLNSLDSMLAIRNFREHIHQIHNQELAKALQMLQHGTSPEAALSHLARSLTNKLMHQPTIQMRQASYAGQLDTLKFAQELFGLQSLSAEIDSA